MATLNDMLKDGAKPKQDGVIAFGGSIQTDEDKMANVNAMLAKGYHVVIDAPDHAKLYSAGQDKPEFLIR